MRSLANGDRRAGTAPGRGAARARRPLRLGAAGAVLVVSLLLAACASATGAGQSPAPTAQPSQSGTPNAAKAGGPVYEGTLDLADCKRIAGWAWDKNQPNTPISVDIYDGGTLLATVTADQFRQGLANAGKGDGNHSFVYASPASVKNGQPHSISAKIPGTSTELKNAPKSITCPS